MSFAIMYIIEHDKYCFKVVMSLFQTLNGNSAELRETCQPSHLISHYWKTKDIKKLLKLFVLAHYITYRLEWKFFFSTENNTIYVHESFPILRIRTIYINGVDLQYQTKPTDKNGAVHGKAYCETVYVPIVILLQYGWKPIQKCIAKPGYRGADLPVST